MDAMGTSWNSQLETNQLNFDLEAEQWSPRFHRLRGFIRMTWTWGHFPNPSSNFAGVDHACKNPPCGQRIPTL